MADLASKVDASHKPGIPASDAGQSPSARADEEALSDADLEKVSGGTNLNPQPLPPEPPREHRKF